MKLYEHCAAERMFMPWILTDEDAAIHLDTDLLFMRPPEDIWQYYNHFDEDDVFGTALVDGYYEQWNIDVSNYIEFLSRNITLYINKNYKIDTCKHLTLI